MKIYSLEQYIMISISCINQDTLLKLQQKEWTKPNVTQDYLQNFPWGYMKMEQV